MLIDVVTVKPGPDFKLDLKFENGERRIFDMRSLLALMRSWQALFELKDSGTGTGL
ncbi:MAG: DUF2442 domain-containing protein [Nitrospirales bacterium]|nr:DUF2442 domain-containing protein [Nitrospirales bacterium]